MSAVVKIARVTAVPTSRRVYRGLGGMRLGPEWFCPDGRGVRSGVELGFLSTTVRPLAPAVVGEGRTCNSRMLAELTAQGLRELSSDLQQLLSFLL